MQDRAFQSCRCCWLLMLDLRRVTGRARSRRRAQPSLELVQEQEPVQEQELVQEREPVQGQEQEVEWNRHRS